MAQTKEGAQKTAAKKAGLELNVFLARVAEGQKRCSRCGQWKNASTDFGKDRSRGDGRDAVCFGCCHVKEPKSHKGRVSTFKGKRHTEQAKRLMSVARAGKPSPLKGIVRTIEERAKISKALRSSTKVLRGAECHSYKDGKLAERRGQRHSAQYKRWRFDVFLRDKFTCQNCGDAKGGNLRAHHIKPFAECPELRFVVDNGITLCDICHNAKHSAK